MLQISRTHYPIEATLEDIRHNAFADKRNFDPALIWTQDSKPMPSLKTQRTGKQVFQEVHQITVTRNKTKIR